MHQEKPACSNRGTGSNSKMVGGTGHYLNSRAELSSGVLEVLRAHQPDFEHSDRSPRDVRVVSGPTF
jgi:hypothetical protein